MVARGCGKGWQGEQSYYLVSLVSGLQDGRVLEMDIGDGRTKM